MKSNVVVEMLSRTAWPHGINQCKICAMTADQPTAIPAGFLLIVLSNSEATNFNMKILKTVLRG